MPKPPPPIDEAERTRKRAERAAKKTLIAREGEPRTAKTAPKMDGLKPWSQRPKPLRGDPAEQTTYAAVGEALSNWNLLEMAMTSLFVTFANAEGKYVPLIARSFGAIRTFEGRHAVLNTASEHFFKIQIELARKIGMFKPSPELFEKMAKEYVELSKNMKESVSRRNEIAHGIVSRLWLEEDYGDGMVLQATPMDHKTDMLSISEYFYDSESLLHYSFLFRDLFDRANEINRCLRIYMIALQEEVPD